MTRRAMRRFLAGVYVMVVGWLIGYACAETFGTIGLLVSIPPAGIVGYSLGRWSNR